MVTKRSSFFAHQMGVTCVAFSPDGKQILSGGFDKSARVWSSTAAPIEARVAVGGHKGQVWFVAYGRDGKTMATCKRPGGQTGPGEVKLWDATTLKEKAVINGFRGPVLGLAFSPDGKALATGGGIMRTLGEVKVWDARTGVCLSTLYVNGWLLACAFHPDGEHIVAAGTGGVYFLRWVR